MNIPDQLITYATDLATSILRSLGFHVSVDSSWDGEEISLMITSPDSRFIIGENGSRLDDLQYILNRLIVLRAEDAPRIRVDCDSYRARSEARLVESARSKAQHVLTTGKPILTSPMNAYHRRLVHSALAEIPGIKTESEDSDSRFKRITISRVEA